jgi:hypothetical protein
LLGAAAALALPFLPLPQLKEELQFRLSETLGRTVNIESARLTLVPRPRVTLAKMTARESPAFGDGDFLTADTVRADIDLVQYLKTRKLVLESITFVSPRINLIKNQDGVWSWTTIGKEPAKSAIVQTQADYRAMGALPVSLALALWDGDSATPIFRKLNVENGSAKVIDHTDSQANANYKNISLTALITTEQAGQGMVRHATGDLYVQSEETDESDLLKTAIPFDLKIARGDGALSIEGSVGSGRVESKNLDIGSFTVAGAIRSQSGAPLTGSGQIIAKDLFVRTINLSEQVSRALKIDQIGDMNPGTSIASLETDFRISGRQIETPGLRIQQLDGLGDATAQTGSFSIEAALTVNYQATIIMSSDATGRVKAISPMVGMLVTILETDKRISVPLNINGDLRKPEIQVDVSRIF